MEEQMSNESSNVSCSTTNDEEDPQDEKIRPLSGKPFFSVVLSKTHLHPFYRMVNFFFVLFLFIYFSIHCIFIIWNGMIHSPRAYLQNCNKFCRSTFKIIIIIIIIIIRRVLKYSLFLHIVLCFVWHVNFIIFFLIFFCLNNDLLC